MFGNDYPSVWVEWADRSYIASRLLWFTGLWLDVPVLGHRTIELYLKAFLVSHGEKVAPGSTAWGHGLSDLGEACEMYDIAFLSDKVKRRFALFERYFNYARYPSEQGNPDDGSLTWFSFDSNIIPMDELVAFLRPRIGMDSENWKRCHLYKLVFGDSGQKFIHQRRAITENNPLIETIATSCTSSTDVDFSEIFNFDLPGC